MDKFKVRLYSSAKYGCFWLSLLVFILIHWIPMAEFNIIKDEAIYNSFCRFYSQKFVDYLISCQWPLVSLACYLSSINSLLCLKRRLAAPHIFILGCECSRDWCLIPQSIFSGLWFYVWIWFTIGFGMQLELSLNKPDFATTAIIMMNACYWFYIRGAFEMWAIFLQIVDKIIKVTTHHAINFGGTDV